MGERGIDALLTEHDLDVLVAPSGPIASRIDPINGDVWPQWVGAGSMAAIAGYPHATVPMGVVHDLPIGVSFIGTAGDDAAILSFAYAYEQRTKLRPEPGYRTSSENIPELRDAMKPLSRAN